MGMSLARDLGPLVVLLMGGSVLGHSPSSMDTQYNVADVPMVS